MQVHWPILTANLTSRYYTTTRDFGFLDADTSDVAEIERVFNLEPVMKLRV